MSRILIAEDDPDILLVMNIILKDAGYLVESTPEGKKIINGEFQEPDLYILDKRIPDMDGIDICKHLKSQPSTRKIPIIMISASPGFWPLAQRVGVEGFLEKPFQIKDLLAKVKHHLQDVHS
jgi:CheY-like chemotaxis protein